MDEFDYYKFTIDARAATSIARWLSVVRLHCMVRTPACVYTNLNMPNKFAIRYNVGCVPVPEVISNVMSEMLERYRAREAFLGKLDPVVKDSLIESGVLHAGAWCTGDQYYALGGRWRVSMTTCVRLSDMLVEATQVVARVDVRRELVQAAAALDLGPVEPAPLFEDEVSWLREHGYRWRSGVVDRDSARRLSTQYDIVVSERGERNG